MKHFYFLLILVTTAVSAKQIEVLTLNYENNILSVDPIISGDKPTTCILNVLIGGTLDIPTSVFFIDEGFLNGTAP